MGPPAEAAVPGLLRQLVYHPVRSEACRALVRVATPRSLPILAAALMQRESAWDVAASLETIGPPTIPMLVSAAVGGGPDAQLPAFGAPAAMLAAHPYDAGPAVPMLLAALRHDRPDIRCGAAGMLGDIGPAAAEAAPALAGLLRDTRTRDAAEAALEQISQDPESHGC
jgi:HEAT repeat protein